jgi:hypothetical protein
MKRPDPSAASPGIRPVQVDPPAAGGSPRPPAPLPPRQLVRCFSDAARPCYLLDGQSRVRFVNQALLEALKTSEDRLLGLACDRPAAELGEEVAALAAWLAIPTPLRRQGLAIEPLGRGLATASATWTGRLVLSLDQDQAGYLQCLWLSDQDHLGQAWPRRSDWEAGRAAAEAALEARRLTPRVDELHAMVGSSPETQRVRRQLQVASEGSYSVCLFGPNGSGKGALARWLHQQRCKREQRLPQRSPLVPVDCRLMDAALMASMLELIEAPALPPSPPNTHDRSQLLLSQLDGLPAEAHSVLAAYLARHPSTVLFATAASDDLAGRYPESMAWRSIVAAATVMSIAIPPLADRLEDIPILADSLLEQLQAGGPPQERRCLSQASQRSLSTYGWPGNGDELVREIREACRRARALTIEPSDFSLSLQTFASHVLRPERIAALRLDRALEEFERSLLEQALAAFPRNRAAAARHLGISRTRFLRRLTQLGLDALAAPFDGPNAGHDQAFSSQEVSGPTTANPSAKSGEVATELPPAVMDDDQDLPIFEEIDEQDDAAN